MGTIAEKLAYVKETKALIKSALIEKGQTVSDTDTFRSYADKVLAIQGGGGSSIVDILPEQELTFVDDPSSGFPALTGFNLFNFMLGETYTVVWGDQTFECECFEGTMGGLPIIGIGNTAAIGGANNELPFAFGVVTAEGNYNGYCMIASLDGSYSKKVRIYQEASSGVQDDRVKYVTFIGLGGVELYRQPVIVGDTCHNPVDKNYIETPTKESTVQYTYTYSGWSLTEGGSADANALEAVTEDRTVYAAFTSTVRQYTITFYDSDGTTVLTTKTLAYGSTPSYTPEKDGYKLTGWNPSIVVVTGNANYTAIWEEFLVLGSGTCGEDITWTLYPDYSLEFVGTGQMKNYTSNYAVPWLNPSLTNNGKKITAISIDSRITRIGDYAFYGTEGVTAIEIPQGVTYIGKYGFWNSGLTSINIPNSVTEIGERAFMFSKLTELVIPDSVVTLGTYLCVDAKKITSVTIGSGVTSIGKSMFNTSYGELPVSEVIFRDTEGWYVTTTQGATSGTNISSSDLADPSTAATLMKTTYRDYYWYKT